MKPFALIKNGKKLDYRIGKKLGEREIFSYFEKLGYSVTKLWFGTRHEFGILQKDNKKFFLKLSTSEGQSILIENEIAWNKEVNKRLNNNEIFQVPRVFETGKFQNKFVWETTDFFEGALLCNYPQSKNTLITEKHITSIIRIIEVIQNLKLRDLPLDEMSSASAGEIFFEKTKSWFGAIPKNIAGKYKINNLLKEVENGYQSLERKSRHGDFTPWHIFLLKNGKIGLFDAEHAMAKGVENYDLAYLIQRIWCVLENPRLAVEICQKSLDSRLRGNDKIRVVLAARAIGGFLDESLTPKPNYKFHEEFKNWILKI